MRLILATQAFFKIIFSRETADRYRRISHEDGQTAQTQDSVPQSPSKQPPKKATPPARSEAITLLEALQREARLLDLIQEPLGDYSNEQIGAAARDVLRDSNALLKRMFDIRPITDTADGESMTTPEDFESGRFHLTGNVTGEAPFTGKVAHHGWEADKCEVPKWNGKQASALVIAPIELEL